VSRGRRSSRRALARSGTVAGPAAATTYPREPITPGLHPDPVPTDPGTYEPAEPEPAGPEQAEPAEAEQAPAEQAEPEEAEQAPAEQAEPEEAGPGPAKAEQAKRHPAEPEQAELEPAEAEHAEPDLAEAEHAERAQASEVAAADPGANGSAAEPDRAGPVTSNEPIGSYYDGADRAIADYLAERGWPQEPETHDPAGHA
jgi:hypothetical protein